MMEQEYCNNCGQPLTTENIAAALEDLGGDVAQERVTFCCPRFTDAEGCPADVVADDYTAMAYYYTTARSFE